MRTNAIYIAFFLSVILFLSCEEEYTLPVARTDFRNDCIKRSLGPNVEGLTIDFVYAMALGYGTGTIVSAQVEASVAGAPGTYLEHRSYHANSSGKDTPVIIGNPSVTQNTKTEVVFTKDTCAAALRYYYKIPPEAKGKEVSFIFSAKASTGETVRHEMGPYFIARMDMALDMVLSDDNKMYFSVGDMAVYDADEAAARPEKVDLVYLYRSVPGVTFAHALVAPAAGSEYLPDVILPPGVDRQTRLIKVYGLRDRHLARIQYGIYVDDPDFSNVDFSKASGFAINMRADYGAWIETGDGKYRAYLFVNAVNNSARTIKISIKRYPVMP